MSSERSEPTAGRIVISAPERGGVQVRRYPRRARNGPRPKRRDPILWSFIAFCAIGVALQTLLLFAGSVRVSLSDVEGALFALGAVVFSPAGLVLAVLAGYALLRGGQRPRRRAIGAKEPPQLR